MFTLAMIQVQRYKPFAQKSLAQPLRRSAIKRMLLGSGGKVYLERNPKRQDSTAQSRLVLVLRSECAGIQAFCGKGRCPVEFAAHLPGCQLRIALARKS